MTVGSHVDSGTGLDHKLWSAQEGTGKSPWVTITVGDYTGGVTLFVRELGVLTDLVGVIEHARQELADELGLLPNGEPCVYVDAFGSIEWSEHDHDQCLETLVDEPIPFVPSELGTAWERHDDPTVEDNPLDDDGWEDEEDEEADDRDDDMHLSPGQRVLRAEGWL